MEEKERGGTQARKVESAVHLLLKPVLAVVFESHSGILQIESEIKAQLTWFQDNVGFKPTHVDGHQHVHVIPQVTSILARIMKERNITKTRNPSEDLDGCSWIEPPRKDFYLSVLQHAKTACEIFEKAGIW